MLCIGLVCVYLSCGMEMELEKRKDYWLIINELLIPAKKLLNSCKVDISNLIAS